MQGPSAPDIHIPTDTKKAKIKMEEPEIGHKDKSKEN